MSVHAGSWHLDRSRPVEVVVAQVECQLLKLDLGEGWLVQGHEEVRWTHAPLITFDWDEEEVKVFALVVAFLDKLAIDDAPTRWVVQSVVVVENEEGLDDPLVYNQKSDLGTSWWFVVQLVEGSLELNNFAVNDLRAFSSTDTITVDNDIGGQIVLVILWKYIDCRLDALFDLSIDNFLTLLLDDEVREVLR